MYASVRPRLGHGIIDDICARTKAAKSGNDRADEIAGHAAQRSAVDEGTAITIYMWLDRAKRVQDRIYDIEQYIASIREGIRPRPLGPKDLAPNKKAEAAD